MGCGIGNRPLDGLPAPRIIRDLRLETVVEVSRWDLELAERIASTWDGDPEELPSYAQQDAQPPATKPSPRTDNGWQTPPASIVAAWDERRVDYWHEECSAPGSVVVADPDLLAHAVWSAQARVLLPWIDRRRSDLCGRLQMKVGPRQYRAEVVRRGFDPTLGVEIGPQFSPRIS